MQINQETISSWMADRGLVCYERMIADCQACIDETIGEAGRYWQECEFTMKRINALKAEIAEIKQSAMDRYNDWASD